MKVLIQKEVRLVLPAWIAAMVLATLPVWLLWPGEHGVSLPTPGVAVFGPFVLGALVLSVASFGQELSLGTFAVLLAQPTSRRRLWLAKTSVLAVALGLAFAALCLSNQIRMDTVISTMKSTVWRNAFQGRADQAIMRAIAESRLGALTESLFIGGLAVIAAFAGGLWTTLLFRQISAAFCFTFFVPMSLTLLTAKLTGDLPTVISMAILAGVLAIYSITAFMWAKGLFARAQDTQWTGGVILFPTRRRAAAQAGAHRPEHKRKCVRALLRKEFQAQQVNLMLAAVLLVLHGITLIIRHHYVEYFASHRSAAMIWESVPLLWFVMPFLVGAVSVAEERKLGTFESSLCLPTSRRLQFIIKAGVALVLGIVLGGVMPLLIEWLGGRLGPNELMPSLASPGPEANQDVLLTLYGVAGATSLAVFGSTLTRSTIQALGAGVVACALAGLAIAGAVNGEGLSQFVGFVPWRGPLVGIIGVPVMALTLGLLAYANYKRVYPGPSVWLRNVLVLLLAAGATSVATSTVYHRAWEAWIPEEANHGPFRFFEPAMRRELLPSDRLCASFSRIALLQRSGRLWLRQPPMQAVTQAPNLVFFRASGPIQTGWIRNQEWRDVAVAQSGCFAIQADGSLWDLSEVRFDKTGDDAGAKKFGADGDWAKICAGGQHFMALRSDGTLWEWGYKTEINGTNMTARQISQPTQIGRDNDWTAIADSGNAYAAVKADGSIWRWGWRVSSTNNTAQQIYAAAPQRWLQFSGDLTVSLSMSDSSIAAVCEDGSLWVGGDLPRWLLGPGQAAIHQDEMVRYDAQGGWSQVAISAWACLIGVKRDGSLWEWDPARFTLDGVHLPTMPSQYYDWQSVCPQWPAFLALATDGGMYLWRNSASDRRYYATQKLLTVPSRIKATKVAQISH